MRFTPDSLADYDDEFAIDTATSRFPVALKARRPPPKLTLAQEMHIGEVRAPATCADRQPTGPGGMCVCTGPTTFVIPLDAPPRSCAATARCSSSRSSTAAATGASASRRPAIGPTATRRRRTIWRWSDLLRCAFFRGVLVAPGRALRAPLDTPPDSCLPQVWPLYYDLAPGDEVVLNIAFEPRSMGLHQERLVMVCDNCQVRPRVARLRRPALRLPLAAHDLPPGPHAHDHPLAHRRSRSSRSRAWRRTWTSSSRRSTA